MYFKHYKKPDVALTKSNYNKALKIGRLFVIINTNQ